MSAADKHLWEYDHPYYAADGCWFVGGDKWGQVHADWSSWSEFYEVWGSNDPGLNLLYRWDWHRHTEEEIAADKQFGFDTASNELHLFFIFMLQRNARPFSHHIAVTEEDEPLVRAYLAGRAETIRAIWEPVIAVEPAS